MVLKIREILDSGVFVLVGRNGEILKKRGDDLALCRLPHLDQVRDTVASGRKALACELCGESNSGEGVDAMLLCELCATGWHVKCVGLKHVPDGDWFCPACTLAGRVPAVPVGEVEAQFVKSLDGRRGSRMFIGADGVRRPYGGVLRCEESGSARPFRIEYDDGAVERDVSKVGGLIFVRGAVSVRDKRAARRVVT